MGVVDIVLAAGLLFFWMDSLGNLIFATPWMTALGLALVARGAAGLLRESREELSQWLSLLDALLSVLVILLIVAYAYVLRSVVLAGLVVTIAVLIKVGEWGQYRSRS